MLGAMTFALVVMCSSKMQWDCSFEFRNITFMQSCCLMLCALPVRSMASGRIPTPVSNSNGSAAASVCLEFTNSTPVSGRKPLQAGSSCKLVKHQCDDACMHVSTMRVSSVACLAEGLCKQQAVCDCVHHQHGHTLCMVTW